MKPLELQSSCGVDDSYEVAVVLTMKPLELLSGCGVDDEATRVAKWLWC